MCFLMVRKWAGNAAALVVVEGGKPVEMKVPDHSGGSKRESLEILL